MRTSVTPGASMSTKKRAWLPGIGSADDLGLEDEMVGMVGAGDVPFLAVQDVVVAVAPRRRLDGVDIGACVGFR